MKMVYVEDSFEKKYTNKGHSVATRKLGTGVLFPHLQDFLVLFLFYLKKYFQPISTKWKLIQYIEMRRRRKTVTKERVNKKKYCNFPILPGWLGPQVPISQSKFKLLKLLKMA